MPLSHAASACNAGAAAARYPDRDPRRRRLVAVSEEGRVGM